MSFAQQGDVLLFQTNDGGDINVVNGTVEMSGGLESAAYLCLFGGNEQDDGSQNNVNQWWGNWGELQERQQRSETQHLLRSIPSVTANLRRIEEAAKRDLERLVSVGVATEISVAASMPGLNRVSIAVAINAINGTGTTITFIENWQADI